MPNWRTILRGLLSPRLGIDGSAASSAPPPGHLPIGIETNAGWARNVPDRVAIADEVPDRTATQNQAGDEEER